jgi:DNA polymerase III alpha subunit
MYGAWIFQEQAKKAGIKPILGMEAYVAPGDRRERSKAKGEKGYYHLVLLARDLAGVPQPGPPLLDRLHGGLLLQAAHRP